VASFISNGVFLPGHVAEDGRILCALGGVRLDDERELPSPGSLVDLLVRPWNVVLADAPADAASARLVSLQFQGAFTLSTLVLADGCQVQSLDERLATLGPGSEVQL